jgi:uncharacterized membrane protein HdeD (DUF308 family)
MSSTQETLRSEPNALAVAREWPALLFMGIVTLALGIVVIVWPSQTLTVLSILLGLQLLLTGIFRLILAFSDDTESPGLTGFIGVLLIIGGVVVLRNPFETVAVLATILGVAWIVIGAVEVIEAIANGRAHNRGMLALGGLLSLAAGIVVVVWPAPTVTVVAWIAGFYLIVFGLFLAASAFALRSAVKA